MAGSILIVVVLIFALRGFFLGVSGVIGRIIGIVLGYYVAYQFQSPLATLISTQLGLNLPILVLKIISGLLLFVGTLFLTGLAVNMTFKIIGNIIPPLKAFSDKQSTTGKTIGAALNAGVAVFISLLVIWGIDQFRPNPPDELVHNVANQLGSSLIGSINTEDWSIQKMTQFSSSGMDINTVTTMTQILNKSASTGSNSGNVSAPNNTLTTSGKSYSKGTATITSATNPSKTLSIETTREVIEQVLQDNPQATQQLLQSPQVQEMLNNPEFRETAMQEFQKNLNNGQFDPQQLQQLLNNPQLRELMDKLETR
ncbi:CvpA family protein [Oceanicoccus sp. KOV_DT_Chl]|uniref:CvpA family protein n=1 Tax=Oceanicoccus sp. KOV_DT_Chl TaxID=1904639 RepID=UPI000C7E7283|nr:CvpA family protein [Oceanicoccus sp. KOV_DT_Chl]